MKSCPKCGRTYTDPHLNFCLEDGELLTGASVTDRPFDDSPPTVILDQARVTNPASGWSAAQPPIPYQQPQMYSPTQFGRSRDQTLPTISLVLGIFSVVLICCYGGLWLGLPGAIVGFIGMRNVDANPERYTGKGMAIAGMIMGALTFLLAIVFIFLGILGNAIN